MAAGCLGSTRDSQLSSIDGETPVTVGEFSADPRELGFHGRRFDHSEQRYWHVDDVTAAVERLLALGAKEHEGVRERGEGFVTASVVDPFGNVLGVMHNAHYTSVRSTLFTE